MKETHPTLSFGEKSSVIMKLWEATTLAEREKYEKMHELDKERYVRDMAACTPADVQRARLQKRKRSQMRKERPSRSLSAYMFFVKDTRESLAKDHPTASFAELGRMLGLLWNQTSSTNQEKFQKLAALDKIRHDQEMTVFQAAEKQKKEEEKQQRLLDAARKQRARENKATTVTE